MLDKARRQAHTAQGGRELCKACRGGPGTGSGIFPARHTAGGDTAPPRRRACTVLWGVRHPFLLLVFPHASGHYPSGHGDTAVDRAPAEGNGPACGIGTEHTGVRRGMHTVPGRRPAHNRLQRLAIVRPLPRAGIHRHSQVCNR